MVDTCAADFEAVTPYFYSTFEQENEAAPLPGEKAVIIGSGPIRIGQGIEFDCCCVQAAMALRERGVAPIMVNSNPETVSTDFDASARLYFDPLDEESSASVLENEGVATSESAVAQGKRGGDAQVAVLMQFGGQTALNVAERIAGIGGRIAGTSADAIALAGGRRRFHELRNALRVPPPPARPRDPSAARQPRGVALRGARRR